MAFAAYSVALANYYLTVRVGEDKDPAATTVGECLVSDLQVGDFVWGTRATVTALGTAGTTRTVTMQRPGGQPFVATFVSASSLRIVR